MTRILCVGNHHRGDDGAAVVVAECLEQFDIHAEVCEDDPLRLIESWHPSDDVIVVDTMLTGAPVGSVRIWEGPLPANLFGARASTHGLGVAEAIHLAETLGRLPRRLRVYGIEGRQFRPEAEMSAEVQRAVERVARRIAGEVTAMAAAD